MEFLKRCWAEINLDNIKYNLSLIKNHQAKINDMGIIAVIKADAYGHGDYQCAEVLEESGVSFFAVSNISEALSLRRNGINSRILIFGGTPPEYFNILTQNNFHQTIYSLEYAQKLSAYAQANGCTFNCHLKIDTGMSRMGFVHNLAATPGISAFEEISKVLTLPGVAISGIYTHFSHSDSTDPSAKAFTLEQYVSFKDIVCSLQNQGHHFEVIHCQNSGGIENFSFDICNYARPGIILYGLPPSPEYADLLPLKAAMELKSTVTDVKHIKKGSYVSYSRKYLASEDITVAIIPTGYADGYFRSLHKEGYVLIHGKQAKILGVICMDQFIVDVTTIAEVKPGDEVILMGKSGNAQITADDLASWAGTINYEIICGVSRRVPRIYIKDNKITSCINYLHISSLCEIDEKESKASNEV